MSDLTYTAPGDQSSLFVGRGMHNYSPAANNIFIGQNIGANTKTDNNILIGRNIDGTGDSIVIGGGNHTEVLIGGFNLTYMVETIQAMQETIDELKQKVIELQYQPGGPGYLESKDSFEKKQLKDVDSLDKNEQIK